MAYKRETDRSKLACL